MKTNCKRILSILVTIILLFCTTTSVFAAEFAVTGGFVLPDDVRAPAEQSFRDADTGIAEMNRFLNGTIGAYIADLDNDGRQEMVDVYLRTHESSQITQIRIGLYENDAAGDTVLRQEFMLCEFYASRMFNFDFKLSYFESDSGIYLISNEIMLAGSGIASTSHIISVGDDKKLYAATSLFDPGYTSGIGLYQVNNTPADKLSSLSYLTGDTLYEWDAGDSGEPSSQAYYSALNQVLAPYGTSAAVSPISGGFFADTPFIIQGETAMIAEVGVDRSFKTKVFHARYSGSDPFCENKTDDSLFEPEKFYHKILTELRPKYADSFCFLDMDGDGREELLIGGMKEVIAVYTSSKDTAQPIKLYYQSPGFPYYRLTADGIVSYDPSPNRHGEVYGTVSYRISNGKLMPLRGYLCAGDYYYTDNPELLMLPLVSDFSEWEKISENKFYQGDTHKSIEPFVPDMTAFAEYDAQHEFNPMAYYQSILNDQRPSYATDSNGYAAGYRFLDLDGDGREELLLGGGGYNSVWAPIRAVYSYDAQSSKPKMVDLNKRIVIQGDSERCFFSYTEDVGSNVSYESGIDESPLKIRVLYRFSDGELLPVCGLAEKYESDRVFYTENTELLSILEEYDYFEWNVGTQSDSKVLEIKALFEKTHEIKPYLYSFAAYDANREYQQIHPETVIPVSGAYGYDALLRKIRGIAAAPHRIVYESQGTEHLSTDDFSHLWLEYYLQGHLNDPCFVLRDLNADGIPELAVGNRAENGKFELFDLYTICDGVIIHLASSGLRDRFSIGADNELIEVGFSGAASGITIAYTLKDRQLVPLRALQVDMDNYYSLNDEGTPAESWENITQSEYEAKSLAEYSVQENPEMISLLTWNLGSAISGDFNGDSQLSVADAVMLARYIGEDETLHDSQINTIVNAKPDQDDDGIVSIMDVVYFLRNIPQVHYEKP